MNSLPLYPLSDELLSAYVDGDVSDEEKQQIELAIATDPDVAWQIESLRQTIDLLHALPPIPLPRSFMLEEAQVADILAARRASHGSALVTPLPSLWQQIGRFFNSGNLALRNASALVAVLFLVLVLGEPMLTTPQIAPQPSVAGIQSAPASEVAFNNEEAAIPAEAPAAQEIAVAKTAPAEETAARMSVAEDVAADAAEESAAEETIAEELVVEDAAGSAVQMQSPAMAASTAAESGMAADEAPPGARMVPVDIPPAAADASARIMPESASAAAAEMGEAAADSSLMMESVESSAADEGAAPAAVQTQVMPEPTVAPLVAPESDTEK